MKHQHVGFKHSLSPLVEDCFGVEMCARTSGWGVIAIFSLSKKIFINSGEGEREKVFAFPLLWVYQVKRKILPCCLLLSGRVIELVFIYSLS